ncbi:MAG: hypothetical protein A4E63_00041 [Syntrophorhabdus sp. PtaU1.Bin050]|nr:MAG: hypothetical protein A4E63_00041 [Syntrophorhabdus sp. PtaU1.Bin050]
MLFAFTTAIVFCNCDPRYGFIEAEFQLADESRLPKWFAMPPGYTRTDFSMTITTYSSPSGIVAKMAIRNSKPPKRILNERIGSKRIHPLTEQMGYDKYPLYSIVTVDGIEEAFEQRRPEPILFITDDPKVTSALLKLKGP